MMRHAQAIVAIGLALIVQLTTFGCKRSADAEVLEQGELVFEETFDDELDAQLWQTSRTSSWRIEEGELHVANARNAPLWLQRELPEDVRIQFEVRALSEEGDLKFEVFGNGHDHQSGYVGIFGGWSNQLNVIARLDEHGDDRLVGADGRQVEPERTYRFDVVRTDDALRWYVDGELFMTYEDDEALRGEDHRHFGFGNWAAPARFDNLRIYDLAP